jgi:hypothetical protein
MALLKSIANGNFTDASTWALCTAVNEVNNANSVLASTTAYVLQNPNLYSSTVTGNAIGVLLKIGVRNSSSGTVSAVLTDNSANILAQCTMNVSDVAGSSLPTTGTSSIYGMWVFFRFNAPVPITSGTFYRIGYRTSVNGALSFLRNTAGAGVTQGAIVTDITQAPAATDRLLILGDNVAAAVSPGSTPGTKTAYTVTMDNTTTTQFGDGGGTTNVPYWSLYVGDNATLRYGTTAATNYNLRVRGHVAVGSGGDAYPGSLEIGTVATPMPTTSTGRLELDSAVSGNHGLYVLGGKLILQGSPRTTGKAVHRCFLNANASFGDTTLTVDTDTGWLSGDEIYIGPTIRPPGNAMQVRTLNADATATTLSISASLTQAIEGNSATLQSHIVLATRNVTISAVASNLNYYINVAGITSIVDCDWAAIRWCGMTAGAKQGTYLDGNASNLTFDDCVWVAGHAGVAWPATNASSGLGGGGLINNCNFVGTVTVALIATTTVQNTTVVNNCWFVQGGTTVISVRNLGFAFDNIRIQTANATGITFNTNPSELTSPVTWSNFQISGCNTGVLLTTQQQTGYIILDNWEIQRCGQGFNASASSTGVLVKNSKFWGNNTRQVAVGGGIGSLIFRNTVFAGQTGNATTAGVVSDVLCSCAVVFEDCSFGTGFTGALAHTSGDIVHGTTTCFVALTRNCIFASTPEVVSSINDTSVVIAENYDQVVGSKRIWTGRGIVGTDTVIFRTSPSSIRLTPSRATFKLEYVVAKCAVLAGTTPTVGIYVRKSVAGDGAAYNGNPPRLIVRRNVLVGIAADTVLATATSAADGAWELLSGSLPALTGTGIVELEVDCDGTVGRVNIADFQAPAAVNTKGLERGDDTLGLAAYGDNFSSFRSPLDNALIG